MVGFLSVEVGENYSTVPGIDERECSGKQQSARHRN